MALLASQISTLKLIPSELLVKKSWAFSCLSGGVPQGALLEVSGPAGGGKTEVVLRFLSEHPALKVAWVEEKLSIYPCAFMQQKVALERVLFVETSRYLWAVQQILKSQIFSFIVLSTPLQTEVELRRLQIATEKAGASLFLITEHVTHEGSWPLSVQLYVSRCQNTGITRLEIIKYRGAKRWENFSIANGM